MSDKELRFVGDHLTQNVMRNDWRLGSIGKYGEGVVFLCLHGAQIGHSYSSAELRKIADRVDQFKQKEVSEETQGEGGQVSEWRFEPGKKMLWEMRETEEDGVAEQEVLTIFFGRDEIGFITGDGKSTIRGTWNPEDYEFLAQKAREYRARAPHRALADRHAE